MVVLGTVRGTVIICGDISILYCTSRHDVYEIILGWNKASESLFPDILTHNSLIVYICFNFFLSAFHISYVLDTHISVVLRFVN